MRWWLQGQGETKTDTQGRIRSQSQARGVLRLEGDNAIDEDFGEIYGLRMWESPKPKNGVSLAQVYCRVTVGLLYCSKGKDISYPLRQVLLLSFDL